ncbi:MAG: HAMP domain-containing histidine kinase [Clostridia bacterium]|nr:HAMP domain-containing histidine kinase [Clostridia bacterium]
MKIRETFEKIRNRKKERLTLSVRMVLWVQLELLACVGLAFLIDEIAHTFNSNWNIPLLLEIVIVSVVVGGVMTAIISKTFFNPIKNLRLAMDRVANGDFSIHLDPNKSSSGEIKELYAGFNLMTYELNATEILQTDFISNVSHEFKTPINAIEGYSTLLQGCENLNSEQQGYVEKILFNTERLSSLVSNILLLSKIENQSIQSKRDIFSLDEQIRETIVALETAWASKNIELDVELDGVKYNGNEIMLRHVWSNLIGNAVKFTPENSTVSITLENRKDEFIFSVADQGEGLSEEAQKHLFDKFYQADTSHKAEGNGLGLALVKQILTIEGGDITAENLNGGGCRFTVTLYAK